MITKIFNALFSKNKKNKCLTLVKNREVFFNETGRCIKNNTTTCLSEYFSKRKGLNKSEREQFYTIVLTARGRQ